MPRSIRGRGIGGEEGGGGAPAGEEQRERPKRTPDLPNNVNQPKAIDKYFNILADFMEYKNKTEYPPEKTFTNEELLEITPEDLRRWMCFCVFGKEDPSNDDNPTNGRASTLAY